MAKYIKNTTGSTVTYLGQDIAASAYYQIQSAEEIAWSNLSVLLTDIGSGDAVVAKDDDGTKDISDVNDGVNYLKDIENLPSDADGVPLSRTKITQSGWHFQAHVFEFTTSKLASTYSKDIDDDDLGFLTIKYYDSSDVELVAGTQAELDSDCVLTVIDWEPDYNYEIIGGTLYQSVVPSTDVRLWILAVPDLTPAQGGSIPFVEGGLNLKHMGTGPIVDLDGKTPKLMSYDATYHTNKFRFTTRHNAGAQCPLMIMFKIFEE